MPFARRARVKRRRVEADPGHDPQYRKLVRVQAFPPPSRGPTTTTTTATAKSGRNFDNTCQDRCNLKKHRNSEAEAERDNEGCERKVLEGVTQAANLQTRQRRWRHRGFLSNEALVGKLKRSIPKLALLPQTVRTYSTWEATCIVAVGAYVAQEPQWLSTRAIRPITHCECGHYYLVWYGASAQHCLLSGAQ